MTIYGYARVSTNGQDLGSQEAELLAAGCAKVFKEKVSGAKTDRAELAKVIRRLEPGDVLIVTRLDRLARSTRDLLNVLATIGERQAGFKSLRDQWADTTTPHGRLMLTVLGGLAEFERELILARTSDGRARAKARGVRFGRPDASHPTPAAGSPPAARGRRCAGRSGAVLWCLAGHDLTACSRLT
jgi:DNA invertase Pin-like site-specific DNA recombinase